MTHHLRPEEFIDALDNTLSPARNAHLEQCEACRAELAGLLAITREAHADGVPEPSPLFWDHFSERVRQATGPDAATQQQWWRSWRPVATLAASAAAAVLMLLVLSKSGPAVAPSAPITTAAGATLEDDGSWDIVMSLASEIAWDDVRDAVAPSADAADAAIEELTAAQREALVRLLKQEIGE